MKALARTRTSRIRSFVASTLPLAIVLAWAVPAVGSFHIADISEVMTSYGGDADVQFVEINMLSSGQQFVSGTKLNAFDASGNFIATVLTVPGNVTSGANRRWIMGTTAFETASGLQVDFEFSPGVILTGGGMVCWGKPGTSTSAPTCSSAGVPYVDCLAYGSYSGPTNNCIGNPNPVAPDGHSLERIASGHDNATQFACANTAEPENNAQQTETMAATTPCPGCGDGNLDPGEQCDDGPLNGDDKPCLSNCQVATCGDGQACTDATCTTGPGGGPEVCDAGDDATCPGDCLPDCSCATCGDNTTEPPAEQCDGTDDGACPGECLPPLDPNECQCPPPPPLDHFLCYKSKTKTKVKTTATLDDPLEAAQVVDLKPLKLFCNPVDKESEGIVDPVTHLSAYKAKGPHVARSGIGATNQFGTLTFDTKKTFLLMVPALKSVPPDPEPGMAPDPANHDVDHYRCLKAKTTKNTPKFEEVGPLNLVDQFGSRQAIAKKPTRICLPTDKNGEGIQVPENSLVCYKLTKSTAKTAVAQVHGHDQFGAFDFETKKEFELCVPSTLTLP